MRLIAVAAIPDRAPRPGQDDHVRARLGKRNDEYCTAAKTGTYRRTAAITQTLEGRNPLGYDSGNGSVTKAL
jgi:hypothetical protein